MSLVFPLARFIVTLVKDQIRLAREEIMGYAGGTACCTAFIDDVIVFAIFLAVRSPPQQCSSFLRDSTEQVLADRISDLAVAQ